MHCFKIQRSRVQYLNILVDRSNIQDVSALAGHIMDSSKIRITSQHVQVSQ